MFSNPKRRAAWLIALAVVAMLGSASVIADRRYGASLDAVRETLALQRAIDDTLSLLTDAETGQRGFILTGDETFLAPYVEAARTASAHIGALRALVSGDGPQTASALEVDRLARIKLDELAETIELRREGRTDEALEIVRAGGGNRLMASIRAEASRMLARERVRLAERDVAAGKGRLQLTIVFAGVWGFFFCAVVAGLWNASRGVNEAKRAAARLAESEKELRAIADNATDLVRIIDDGARLAYVSPSCQRILGFTREEMLSMPPRALLPESQREPARDLTLRVQGGDTGGEPFVHRLCTKSGEYRWFETTYSLVREGGRDTGQILLTSRDITERKQAQEALQKKTAELESAFEQLQLSEERMRILSEASFEGIAVSKSGVVVDTNENFASWLGRTREELVGTVGMTYYPAYEHDRIRRLTAGTELRFEANMLRRDGTEFPVEVRGRALTVKGEPVRIAVIRDITERRKREAEAMAHAELLRSMSLRDELTGLYNRRGFLEHAQQALRTAVRTRRSGCLFFADLDGMKAINDGLGHETGDRALVATAKLFTAVFRDSDIVARLGGDEFAILAPDCGSEHVERVRERIQAHLDEQNRTGGEPFQLSISVGHSVYEPGTEPNLTALMEAADQAMYEEKRRRSPSHHRQTSARRAG